MTGDPVAGAQLTEHRLLTGALLTGMGAACVEAASGRGRDGVGYVSVQGNAGNVPLSGVRNGISAEQRLGIKMEGMVEQLAGLCQLHDLAQLHDSHTVADVLDGTQAVGDEQIGQPQLLLDLLKQVQDLRLYGHVQGGDGLVAD